MFRVHPVFLRSRLSFRSLETLRVACRAADFRLPQLHSLVVPPVLTVR
jgi:hypothetical protein